MKSGEQKERRNSGRSSKKRPRALGEAKRKEKRNWRAVREGLVWWGGTCSFFFLGGKRTHFTRENVLILRLFTYSSRSDTCPQRRPRNEALNEAGGRPIRRAQVGTVFPGTKVGEENPFSSAPAALISSLIGLSVGRRCFPLEERRRVSMGRFRVEIDFTLGPFRITANRDVIERVRPWEPIRKPMSWKMTSFMVMTSGSARAWVPHRLAVPSTVTHSHWPKMTSLKRLPSARPVRSQRPQLPENSGRG